MTAKSVYYLLLMICLILFCGCMHPNHPFRTGYNPNGFSGGYTEKSIGKNAYKVSFIRNGFTDPNDAYSSLLFRCLELADQNHASYITIKKQGSSVFPMAKVYAEIEILEARTNAPFLYKTDELHKHLMPWMQRNALVRKTRGVK